MPYVWAIPGGFIWACHGSHFEGVTGTVLNCQAPTELSPIEIKVVGGTIYET